MSRPNPTPQASAIKSLDRAVRHYRIMAFTTGTLLTVACIALFLKDVAHVKHMEPGTGLLWLFHGWVFILYVLSAFFLGLKLRWSLLKMLLVMVAGTIPLMSFVAEHLVMKRIGPEKDALAARLAAAAARRRAAAQGSATQA